MSGVSAEELAPAYGRVVLLRGNSEFTVQDVLAHAWFLGEVQEPWEALTEAKAAEECATELELDPDEDVINSMLEDFRYGRDLLTIEETERWLAARDLTEDDLNDYLVRRYWKENPPECATAEASDYLEGSPELRDLLRADLMFSGRFEQLTRAVSRRLAAWAERNQTGSDANSLQEERSRFFERTGLDEGSLPEALKQLNKTPAWLEECLQMESWYRQVCDSILTDQARTRILTVMRLPLTRISIRTLTLRSKDAAQEAVLCLKEDRLSPEQLAEECGVAWEEQEFFIDDCVPELQQEFLSGAPGEVLAPKGSEESFFVHRIEAKKEPDLADEPIRERIDEHLMKAHFSELSSKHIRWVLGQAAG